MNNFQEQLTEVGHQRTSALAHSLENLQSFPCLWFSAAGRVWHADGVAQGCVRQRERRGQVSLERMTKQGERTKHLKDVVHVLSACEIVSDVLSCAFKNNLVKQIVWRGFREKVLLCKRILELWYYLSFFPSCSVNSVLVCQGLWLKVMSILLLQRSPVFQKRKESNICFGGNRPGLGLVEVFLILQGEVEVLILPGLLLKPHWYPGYMLPSV